MVPALEIAIVPVPPTIEDADPRVSKPAKLAGVAELFITAPLLEIPLPFTVNASALLYAVLSCYLTLKFPL